MTIRIIKTIEIPYSKVHSLLQSGISSRFQIFPDKIMTGKINGGKINTVINPPFGWADPFKSRVNGVIKDSSGKTDLILEIRPGWTIVGFYVIWYTFLLTYIIVLILKNTNDLPTMAGILIILTLFPLALGKLKINWDKRRLNKWLENKIKTVPNIK